MCQDKFLRIRKPKIEIERTDNRLERIREDVWIILSLCEDFATRKLDYIRNLKCPSDFCKIASSDERGADISHFSLWILRKILIEFFSRNKLENRITEKFETFIRSGISWNIQVQDRAMNTRKSVE